MAKDATRVRVALNGNIWVADEGATLPTDVDTAPATGWADLGYTTDDGVTFTIGKETETIMGWQSADPLRTLVTSEPKTVAFTLRQLGADEITATLGGAITESEAGSGNFRWEPGEPGDVPVKMLLVDFVDGTNKYRFGFRRAQQLGESEIALVRTDAVNLPNEWSVLAASGSEKPWFIDSNDPAFTPAAA